MTHGKQTVSISIEDKVIGGILVAGGFEITVEYYCYPEEREMGYVREPACVEVYPELEGSYADDYIFLYTKEGDDIMLDPKEDYVLYRLAELPIIEWIIENCQEQIEEALHEEAAARDEAAAEARYDHY